MSILSNVIDEVAAAAQADADGSDPKAHAKLLQTVQKLTLAAEKPSETVKRILYQVSIPCIVVQNSSRKKWHNGLIYRSQPPTNMALRIAVEVGLLGAVGAVDGSPITAQDLAKSCHVEELLVGKQMSLTLDMG